MHPANCFVTLTYDEKHLPKDGSLCLEHVQLFLKRLRFGSAFPLRYFLCGEYGEKTSRPHYHICLFGTDFKQANPAESDNKYHVTPSGEKTPYPVTNSEITQPLWKPFSTTKAGHQLYTADRLTETWGMGHAIIGDLNFESAAYVARYCLKKAELAGREDTLEKRKKAYAKWLNGRKAEFVQMSRGRCPDRKGEDPTHEHSVTCGGIGSHWFRKYSTDVYPSDSVVMRGREMLPPPAYDRLLEQVDPALFERIKKQRAKAAKKFALSEDSTSRRLRDAEIVKEETIKNTLRRSV